ncbi:hypothetical protein [Nocardia sp. A7]
MQQLLLAVGEVERDSGGTRLDRRGFRQIAAVRFRDQRRFQVA